MLAGVFDSVELRDLGREEGGGCGAGGVGEKTNKKDGVLAAFCSPATQLMNGIGVNVCLCAH